MVKGCRRLRSWVGYKRLRWAIYVTVDNVEGAHEDGGKTELLPKQRSQIGGARLWAKRKQNGALTKTDAK